MLNVSFPIGGTPECEFKIPFTEAEISDFIVSFSQKGKVIVRKRKEDCVVEDNHITVPFSQEESLEFDYNSIIEMQIKVKVSNGKVRPSNIMRTTPERCIDKEVV